LSNAYDARAIEKRWQDRWEEQRTFRTPDPGDPDFDPERPKFYVLDFFPYPSGAGLHVGHPVGYLGTDIVARRKRMEGFNVLHPMGWDAFGLPTEQNAVATGRPPAEITAENVATFKRQMRLLGLSYDWEREVSTADPAYYRWTQWIFARLYEKGLAYQAEVPVWWCEELKTVLANEEVIGGRSERGDHPCVRRPLKQWMLRITAYADRLLDGLDELDWPESIRTMQREWIGRSEGGEIRFPIEGFEGEALTVFTTRPDTLWGATFMVVAPEHPLLGRLTGSEQRAEVEAYAAAAATRSDVERTGESREKTGVFTGSYCLNPLGDPSLERDRLPIFVADYVLASYGTGAIMCVPGHDERDYEFARAFDLPVREVVRPPEGVPGLDQGVCFTGEGTAVDSGPIDGLPSPRATERTLEILAGKGAGEARTSYRLRDWLFSRQRYWGEPYPVLHLADGTIALVPDGELPVELPELDDFRPSPDGSAPLARATEWVEVAGPDGRPARRETDTMPNWAGSCWYWLRFMDPHNAEVPFSAEAEAYWGPVDLYVGGAEHAVMHLLYARFWHMVLHDLGLVSTREPFQRLFNQGMLTAYAYEDGTGRLVPSDEVEPVGDESFALREGGAPVKQVIAKMSKSLRNVVNPDDVCSEYGVDTFRLYEMFMGPLADSKPWNPRDVPGCRRFLERVWRMIVDEDSSDPARPELLRPEPEGEPEGEALELERALHRALQRVDDSFERMNFNTAIAGLMTFVNEAGRRPGALRRSQAERFVLALAPFAPHAAEELWERLGHAEGAAHAPWPRADQRYLVEEDFELVVQVLGRVRGRTRAPVGAPSEVLERLAREAVAEQLAGKEVVKTVVVPGRLVNFVVR